MASHGDGHIVQSCKIDLPQEARLLLSRVDPELLIEITIIDLAAPANTECIAAHEAGDRSRIECVDQ